MGSAESIDVTFCVGGTRSFDAHIVYHLARPVGIIYVPADAGRFILSCFRDRVCFCCGSVDLQLWYTVAVQNSNDALFPPYVGNGAFLLEEG